MNDINLNFLPDDYRQRTTRRRAVYASAALALAVIVGLSAGVLQASASLRQSEQRHAAICSRYEQATARFQQLAAQRQTQQKIIQQAASAASLVDLMPRSNILAELTNCLPDRTSLIDLTLESHAHPTASNSFDQKKAAIKASQAGPAEIIPSSCDVNIHLTGLAETDVQVAQYLSQLSRSNLFQDVNLVVSEPFTPQGKHAAAIRKFQIQMVLKPDARIKTSPPHDATLTANAGE